MSSRETILKYIEEHGASSAEVLRKATGVSRQAAQKAAAKLVKEGILAIWEKRGDGQGRPTVLFDLATDTTCHRCDQAYDDSGHCGCVLFPCTLCGMEIQESLGCHCKSACECRACSFCSVIVEDGVGSTHCKHCYARARPASYVVLVAPRNGSVLVPRLTVEQRDRLMIVKGKIAWEDEVLTGRKLEFVVEYDDYTSVVEREWHLSPNDGILYNSTADRFESFDNGQWSPVSAARAGSPSPDYIFVASEKRQGGSF